MLDKIFRAAKDLKEQDRPDGISPAMLDFLNMEMPPLANGNAPPPPPDMPPENP